MLTEAGKSYKEVYDVVQVDCVEQLAFLMQILWLDSENGKIRVTSS